MKCCCLMTHLEHCVCEPCGRLLLKVQVVPDSPVSFTAWSPPQMGSACQIQPGHCWPPDAKPGLRILPHSLLLTSVGHVGSPTPYICSSRPLPRPLPHLLHHQSFTPVAQHPSRAGRTKASSKSAAASHSDWTSLGHMLTSELIL